MSSIFRLFYLSSIADQISGCANSWCFYINLPVGGIALVTTKLFVHFPSHHKLDSLKLKDKLKYFDILGVFTVTVSVVCMVLGLQYGGNTYPWSNGRVIALFVLSGVFMIIWVASQIWKKEYALLPMRILRQRSMRSSFLFILACSSSLVISEYYVSYFIVVSVFPPCAHIDHKTHDTHI